MTQKTLDTFCQEKNRESRKIFFRKSIKKSLSQASPPCYSLRVSNPTKKTAIIVRNKEGKLVNAYYPNNIGRTFAELYDLAKQEANKIGGYVTL